jgi:hypothetical protein
MVTKKEVERACEEAIGDFLALLYYDPDVEWLLHLLHNPDRKTPEWWQALSASAGDRVEKVLNDPRMIPTTFRESFAKRVLEDIRMENSRNYEAAYRYLIGEIDGAPRATYNQEVMGQVEYERFFEKG